MIFPKTVPKSLLKGLFFFLIFISTAFYSLAQPAISGFSPASGPVGTAVTITGVNFSATPANNVVFVGGVKATVTSASSGSLTVTVPAGALFQPITVTTNGLTAYARNSFIVTFAGAASQFTSRSFDYAGRLDSVASGTETTDHAAGDLDDDKKLDVVTIDRLNNTLSVYRNTTAGGVLSFAPKMDFLTGNNPGHVAVADIDGDGKRDVIVTNQNDNSVSIFKNTSVSGLISFAPRVDFSTAPYPAGISVADMDNDGRPDLVIHSLSLESTVSVLRNTTSGGSISFGDKVEFMTLSGNDIVRTADIDGDGKTDILVPDHYNSQVQIYRNTASPGALSFAAKQGIANGGSLYLLEVGDLNSDGKPDLLVTYPPTNSIYVLTNMSTAGAISFGNYVNYPVGNTIRRGMVMNDLDGDGKPDIAVGVSYESIALFKNMSAGGGAMAFNSGKKMETPFTGLLAAADFDNDGKPELAAESGILRLTFWGNRTTSPQVASFSPGVAGAGATITINGVNFTAVNAVSFGGLPAASFNVVNDNTITAVVGAGASGQVTVKTAQDSGSAEGFVFTAPPIITGFTPTNAPDYGTVTITGNYFRDVTYVSFGGWTQSFYVIDEHTIKATINNAASGAVLVRTKYGETSMPGFTYAPLPKINSFTPTMMGAGTTVSIIGEGLSNVTAVSFGGVPARSITPISSAQVNAVVDVAAAGSTIVVTTPYGTATKDGIVFVPAPVVTAFSPTSATTGELVTITGTDFGYVEKVQLGGVPVYSFSVQSSTTILAYVGAGATGDVSVIARYGKASLPGFTYKPRPVVTSFSPTSGPAGTTVSITGEHFSNAQKVYFGDSLAASFTVVSDNIIQAVTGRGSYGSIVVYNDVGYGYSSESFNFQYPLPEITSFTPASGTTGAQITIKGKNFVPGRTSAGFGNMYSPGVVCNSDTLLTATVGAGSSGDVYVGVMGGYAYMSGFTYIPPPPVIYGIAPSRGIEGTAVIIRGDKFAGTSAVTFGGVPAASFTVLSDTYITAIVGKGASGDVAVTTPGGTAIKSDFIFGETVIKSISPATGGPGTVVTITGEGFVGVSGVYFGDAHAPRTVSSSTSMTVTVPSDGAGLVTIYFGDGSLICSDAFTYQSPVTNIASVTPGAGGPGTTVSINGSGFSQATAVTFGGVRAASYTVNSPSSITATLAGGALGNVAVTSPLGTGIYNGFSFTTAPVITRFSPEAALSGSTITLTGSNFNPIAAANIVYFGGLKGEVVTASEKSLTVKVSAGAPYSYISVTNNKLTGYSQKKFSALFTATAPLNASSFEAKTDIAWGTSPQHINAADFDLDGKPDVAVCHAGSIKNSGHLAIFKNNSITGSLSFLPKDLITDDHMPFNSVTGDLDGDGKLDLMVANGIDGENLTVYRNASIGNSISFDPEILLALTGVDQNFVACTDVDADGKPDIIIAAAYGGRTAFVYRNTSTIGNLSFVKVAVSVPDFVQGIKVADMDLDGRPDLIMVAQPNFNSLRGVTLRNISTPGSIAFEAAQVFQTGPDPRDLVLGDIDGDGKMDIVAPGGSNTISIVRNLSLPGKISMGSKIDFVTNGSPKSMALGDLNGDGKPDILTSFSGLFKIAIIPNTSTPGNFSFGQSIEINTTAPVNSICVSDQDSDQRPDIIVSNDNAGSISFFRNKLSAYLLNSFSPVRGSTGTVVTIRGEHLGNATVVTIGEVPVTSFTVVDDNTITAVVGAGRSGNVSVTTPLGTIQLSGFVYVGPPTITSFTPTTAGTASTVIIKGMYFTGATAVSFGGVPARSFNVTSDSTITAIVGLGASGTVAVTTPIGKGTRDGFIYDPLTAIVDPGNINSSYLTVQPNPAHDVLIIKHPASSKAATLRFIDITGRVVKVVVPAQNATQTVTSVNGIPEGIYTIIWREGSNTLSRVIAVQ
ncbi:MULTISPECIES: IPT/TIG domain-containing protein [Niastella]|uniref:IPT/TIG domain-containing protein n=1 Tax=Niastella soli TaxID=2821487 RepID=A0ABS3YL89_9BACT|nr:IPT/TIG domain-containing protein [Niastella soli]MBO9198650.1 IPT/TIG domain-containing protein [Niastella soli]